MACGKIVKYTFWGFCIYYLIAQPVAAAGIVRGACVGVTACANQVGDFLTGLARR